MEKTDHSVELKVEGMTCSNCALGITRFLENKGLKNVNVNFATGEVIFDTLENNLQPYINGINQLGYKVVTGESEKNKRKLQFDTIEIKFFTSLVFTLPLLLSMLPFLHFLHNPNLQLILCIPVYAIGVWYFGRSAIASLRTGVPNMDVLIFIGSSAAFFYSLYGYLRNLGDDYMFFETAASIITLVLLGNLFEHRSVKQTTTAIRDLKKLQPEKAKRVHFDLLSGNDHIDEVPIAQLILNDVVLVNSGDKIPADGIIISGDALVDESMITGESIPVRKQKDDIVTGATIITDGTIKVKVTAKSDDSVLAGIIQLVKKAQAEKPSVQKLADKISGIFVPAVLSISAITFLISYFVVHINAEYSLLSSIAVLVIACPCAMGLATPTAIMVGLGRAAKNGILIKGAATLETFAKINCIVFDKTGTLTTGDFEVRDIKIVQGDESEISALIFALEKNSSHPIAKSLLKHFKAGNNISISKSEEIKGLGIIAEDNSGNKYKIGSPALFNSAHGNEFDIFLERNNQLLAAFNIRDAIMPGATEMIRYFHNEGINTILLSGDKEEKCKSVAEQAGIEKYYAAKKPAEKLEIIRGLKKEYSVGMVGDGINDSPSLETADVGISMSNATQIAINSAQIILLHGDLNALIHAHQLSKKTLRTINQNLFWAFFYNVIAIPVAAIGLLSPIIAALSMAFSDVFVIGNSILLKTKKIK